MSWLQSFRDDRDRATLERVMERGVFAGLVASGAMGFLAMMASATYQRRGFFTPMYHAAFVIDEDTMATSITKAAAGDPFYLFRETFIFGFIVYVILGGTFGIAFAVGAKWLQLQGNRALVAGLGYGLGIMVVMNFLVLPMVANALGAGDPISRMGAEAGWPTFIMQFAVYGLTLGSWVYIRPEDIGVPNTAHTPDPAVPS